jgi:predicted aldo/keto reductase-like oxidoreductase
MVHGLKDPAVSLDAKGVWRKLKDRLQREKKIRFMGFSTHAEMGTRVACLNNAVKGGWVDAALVACDPGLIRSNDAFDKALTACADAGIGLMAMKTSRGLGKAATRPADSIPNPFDAMGLSPHHAMQAGIWSDERFAAVCTEMPNRKLIEANANHARRFDKPFDAEQWRQLDAGMKKLARSTCPGCDGSCRRAAGAKTDFCSITRYLAYYDEDGKHEEARALFAALPDDARDWTQADLEKASDACLAKLDFASLLPRAKRLLG